MVKAYSYVRISSRSQKGGRGIDRQLEEAREYAARNGLELDDSLRDLGKSGYSGAHIKSGALGRFLELVETGQIAVGSYLLVENLDRLSRQVPVDAQAQFLLILKAGIKIVTLADRQVYERDRDFTQLIISLTIMSRGHEESQIKSVRSRDNHAHSRKAILNGAKRFTQRAPNWIKQVRVEGSRFEYAFELNDHAKTIQRIYDLADNGVGSTSIARILNDENVPALMGGKKWWDTTIQRIFVNESVIGTHQVVEQVDGKMVPVGDPIPNYFPAAVSEELFWRVQRNRKKMPHRGRTGRSLSNLFPLLSHCAHCGGRLSVTSTKNKTRVYLKCNNRKSVYSCTGPASLFPYRVLENAVLDHVKDIYFDSDLTRRAGKTSREELVSNIALLDLKISDLEKRRKNTLAMAQVVDSDEDRADLQTTLRSLRPQIDQTRAELSELQTALREIDDATASVVDVVEMIAQERAMWATGTEEGGFVSRSRVSQALRNFITNIVIDFANQYAIVHVAGYSRMYQFNREGVLVTRVNGLNMLFDEVADTMRDDGSTDVEIAQAGKAYTKIKAAG